MEYAEIIFGQDTKEKSMIKSMTGFGRCEIAEADRKITVEMKSVNHRYLDVTIKMPKKLNFFEAAIRKGLMIRDCSTFPFLDNKYIRFCFMNPSDNDALLKVLLEQLNK